MNKFILILKDKLRNPIRTVLLYFYKFNNISFKPNNKKQIIIVCDGFTQHGGLVDRLKGILSFYETAKQTGFEFKIYHKFPYQLKEFLEPNQYDWIATEEDIKWNPFSSMFHYRMLETDFNPIEYFQKTTKKKHIVYNNMDYLHKIFPNATSDDLKKKWSENFQELFKKSSYLEAELQKLSLPEKRIAVHSRFCSILGDFVDTERKNQVLSPEEQAVLLNDLKDNIKKVAPNYTDNQICVFSDSIIYLDFIKKNTNYIVLDGEPIHPDNKDEIFSLEQHLKTILDFFVIATCDEIVLLRKPFMYSSAYTKHAAYLYQKPFKEIVIP
jgi:hypothetical protein